jgi:hypothetical protein
VGCQGKASHKAFIAWESHRHLPSHFYTFGLFPNLILPLLPCHWALAFTPDPGPTPHSTPRLPTSCWVLSVLLHSSLRFSSSERSTLSHRRWAAPPGSSPRPEATVAPARPREGLRPASANAAVASLMLGSSPASVPPSARLYSAHRFRIVSKRWRS